MDPLSLLIRAPAILLALTVHELSHGLAAKLLGDPTAEQQGRLTLNPLAHLDFLGTMMLFFGPFGWAKPVPVNPLRFTNPRQGMALVAVAGPLSNICLAGLTGLLFKLDLVGSNQYIVAFFWVLFMINIGLAVFNLLPVYPLDGSRVLMAFLNRAQLEKYLHAMKYVPMLFLLAIVAEYVFKKPILGAILSPIFTPAFKLAKHLFL